MGTHGSLNNTGQGAVRCWPLSRCYIRRQNRKRKGQRRTREEGRQGEEREKEEKEREKEGKGREEKKKGWEGKGMGREGRGEEGKGGKYLHFIDGSSKSLTQKLLDKHGSQKHFVFLASVFFFLVFVCFDYLF